MSVNNMNVQKIQLRGPYKKISPELKFQIISELEFYSIKELSKRYGISRQTIASFPKAREHIYDKFKNKILNLLKEFVDMRLKNNVNFSEKEILIDIDIYMEVREYFKYSQYNLLKDLIPNY
ncbi:unnamed protein product [Paramecium pentaurelia]|uniref:HTH psq-type domain-containing protein n=1 Tax=Paramecium pentaurelia TaxID=43138 RepID=A0A8S1SR44_9CILI|nr:unnamed protein product [Paramecium pentaurelia]